MPGKDQQIKCFNQFPSIYAAAKANPTTNLREINMSFCNHRITLCGQAHPNEYENEQVFFCFFLKKAGIQDVIQLKDDIDKFHTGCTMKDALGVHRIKVHVIIVQDMHPPTIDQIIEILRIVGKLAKDCKSVLIHCGEGWGRTGVTLAALLILSDMVLPRHNTKLKMGHYAGDAVLQNITPEVVSALNIYVPLTMLMHPNLKIRILVKIYAQLKQLHK